MRATQRYDNVVISGLAHVDAPYALTSAEIESRMSRTMERLGIEPGLLSGLSGIEERRVHDLGVMPSDGAAKAGEAALADSGVDREQIGVLLNTSVCRDYLEPSTACLVHGKMQLPATAVNFDIGNACLGFLNGMNTVAAMIERGEIDHGLVVDGETSRFTLDTTIERLAQDDCTDAMFREQFATLTLGSGAAAVVMSREGTSEQAHRYLGGLSRAATQHANLCVGHVHEMKTDTRGLLMAGLQLSEETWKAALTAFEWDAQSIDTFAIHQVSKVHTSSVAQTLGLDPAKIPMIYPGYGNIGPAGVPTVLSKSVEDGTVTAGSKVLLMGVGSGLNVALAELEW